MIKHFPRQIANVAIGLYFFALVAVSLLFYRFMMPLKFMVIGGGMAVMFFTLAASLSQKWKALTEAQYVRNLLLTSAGLRAAWVLFSYFFYLHENGDPFEYLAADSFSYWEDSVWLSHSDWATIRDYLFTSRQTVSDSGYVFYLTMLGKVFGTSVIAARLFKVGWSTLTVYLVYRLARRNVGEDAGRLAGIFMCLFPNFIIYCGLHLKETEMVMLAVVFLERTDYLLRSRSFNVLNILLPVLTGMALFTFRTVMGATVIFAAATALVFTSSKVVGGWRRAMLIGWGVLAVATLAGGTISAEVEDVWEGRNDNQAQRRAAQEAHGNRWSKYATGTVMLPMSFVQPLPTMVSVEYQENQEVLHGGNFVRNFLGVFVLIAIYSALFVTKNWRDLSLIGGYTITYLGIISMSAFAGSERFLLPAAPGLLIMAAFGVTQLTAKTYRWVKIWYIIVPIMAIAWAYFKLGTRALL